jgi:trans-2,3-dihydro-3-hydroxyanthranilate isomerase
MTYDYFTCDVFTDKLFTGNQLAVIPHAEGLYDKQMQQIAREFNFSETTFVFPGENGGTKKLRIFTPSKELPFAGHPNIGTAFVLASSGAFGEIKDVANVTFEEEAGVVEINISIQENGNIFCELKAPGKLSLGSIISVDLIAGALSIQPADIITDAHAPQAASVGLPFVMVELKDISVLRQVKADLNGFEKIVQTGINHPSIFMYVKNADGFDLRARMFDPLSGIYEDPATGSANCAVSALLSYLDNKASGIFNYRIGQGFEMGRDSILKSRVEKKDGEIISVYIGGDSIMSCKGTIRVE